MPITQIEDRKKLLRQIRTWHNNAIVIKGFQLINREVFAEDWDYQLTDGDEWASWVAVNALRLDFAMFSNVQYMNLTNFRKAFIEATRQDNCVHKYVCVSASVQRWKVKQQRAGIRFDNKPSKLLPQ